MSEKVIVRISTHDVIQVSEKDRVWCVEYQQGTTSSYRYVSARDEIEAYKKFKEQDND